MMRPMRVVAALSGVVVTLSATPALADGYSFHLIANVRAGWTDNLQSAESETSAPPREADAYTQIAPGVLATWEKPRIIQEYFYEAEANLYVEHSEAWSLNHRAGWRAFWLLSPLSELTTTVSGATGTLNTFTTTGTSQAGTIEYLPTQRSQFTSVEVRELYTRQLSRALRLSQTGEGRVFHTSSDLADSTGYSIGQGLGIERAWNFNAIGLNATAAYAVMGAGEPMPDHTLITGATLAWRRDLSDEWSSLVDVGYTAIVPVDEADVFSGGPTAGASVGYYPEWGSAGLSLRRTIAPNLFLEANTITDLAVINAWLPLPWFRQDPEIPRLTFGASAGAGRSAIVDATTGESQGGLSSELLDVGFSFAIAEQLHVGARYQFVAQQVDDAVMLENVRPYERHTALVTFYGRWPSRVAAEVPMRATLRVDRRNVTPVGEEVNPQGGTEGPAR